MNISSFLQKPTLLLDVRSPAEFAGGHIPKAHSFPLFSDKERALVGTLYKQEGKQAALSLGLELVGPKLSYFVEEAHRLAPEEKLLRIYCARGGLRSSSLAWLLQTAGFSVTVLEGGYKRFRSWVLQQFTHTLLLKVLGGFTGSGKTHLLHQLKNKGAQVLFLEELACHKGSSFGHLGLPDQPTIEQFENALAINLSSMDLSQPIWIEDESQMIGSCRIPDKLWQQMKQSPLFWLQSTKEDRIVRLCKEYGHHSTEELISATRRLTKRIGRENVEEIVSYLSLADLAKAAEKILTYYDKTYVYSLQKQNRSVQELTRESLSELSVPIL